jgi:hypothetical protein
MKGMSFAFTLFLGVSRLIIKRCIINRGANNRVLSAATATVPGGKNY